MKYCVNVISILDGLEEKKKERNDKRKSNEKRDRIVAGYSIKDEETRQSWTVIKDIHEHLSSPAPGVTRQEITKTEI